MPDVVYCPVCNAPMKSMGLWATYPDNRRRLYQSTFVCNNCPYLNNPPSVQTQSVGYLYHPNVVPPAITVNTHPGPPKPVTKPPKGSNKQPPPIFN